MTSIVMDETPRELPSSLKEATSASPRAWQAEPTHLEVDERITAWAHKPKSKAHDEARLIPWSQHCLDANTAAMVRSKGDITFATPMADKQLYYHRQWCMAGQNILYSRRVMYISPQNISPSHILYIWKMKECIFSKNTLVLLGQDMTILSRLTPFPNWTYLKLLKLTSLLKWSKTKACEVDIVCAMN